MVFWYYSTASSSERDKDSTWSEIDLTRCVFGPASSSERGKDSTWSEMDLTSCVFVLRAVASGTRIQLGLRWISPVASLSRSLLLAVLYLCNLRNLWIVLGEHLLDDAVTRLQSFREFLRLAAAAFGHVGFASPLASNYGSKLLND